MLDILKIANRIFDLTNHIVVKKILIILIDIRKYDVTNIFVIQFDNYI
jgi:hypothetical protein